MNWKLKKKYREAGSLREILELARSSIESRSVLTEGDPPVPECDPWPEDPELQLLCELFGGE